MLKIIKICVCIVISVMLVSISYSFATTITVNTKVLNVRSEPSPTSTKIGTVKYGQKYDVLDKADDWFKIDYNNNSAWVSSNYVIVEENVQSVEEEAKHYKKVIVSTLNVRATNASTSKKVGSLKLGAEVQVLETISNWDKIIAGNLTGWVCNDYLIDIKLEDINIEYINEKQIDEDIKTVILKTAVINTTTLNVRENSTVESNRLGTLKKNAIVAIVGEENGWYKIKYNNQYGYILSDYTFNKDIEISRGSYSRNERPTTVAETATTLALQYIGCKYVWGGTSPNGFDCSGLVYYVYKDYVPNLGRSAKPQSKTGTTIAKENLVMGDLVFFGENGGSLVTHVGIYVGDGIFVHAANPSRGVVTDTILSGYYDKNYLYGKRIA